jgi:hypothetical protein
MLAASRFRRSPIRLLEGVVFVGVFSVVEVGLPTG